jgi:hypothetical protein
VKNDRVIREGRVVHHLAGPVGAHLHERLECREVLHLFEKAEIALEVGLYIRRVEVRRVNGAAVGAGEEAGVEEVLVAFGLNPGKGKFPHREGEEFDDPDPAGERLGYPLHRQEVLRAGEGELSRSPVFIKDALEVREELRDSLHLVENRSGLFVVCKKTARVLFGKGPGVRILQ